VVSFIGGGKRNTRRKPRTCRKTLTNFITSWCVKYTSPWAGFELTTSGVIGTDCIGSCESNYHTITNMTVPFFVQRALNRQYADEAECFTATNSFLQIYDSQSKTLLCHVKMNNDHGYVPFVAIIIWSFPHSWLITGFLTRVTWRYHWWGRNCSSFLEHMRSSPDFSLLNL